MCHVGKQATAAVRVSEVEIVETYCRTAVAAPSSFPRLNNSKDRYSLLDWTEFC
jgi:hypothetical protein